MPASGHDAATTVASLHCATYRRRHVLPRAWSARALHSRGRGTHVGAGALCADVTEMLCVAARHFDDLRLELDELAARLLEAATALVAGGDGDLVTGPTINARRDERE